MTPALKYTLYIGSGLLLGLGAYFTITSVMASKEDKDKKAKEAADKAAAEAAASGSTKPPVLNTSPTNTPPPVNVVPGITGKVSDAVSKYPDSKLVGKPVYATGAWTAFNTAGKIYTKTKAGQLLGTFAYSKIKLSGGKNVYIKTTDSANPYIYMGDTLLTF